jgi:hypothetical protein
MPTRRFPPPWIVEELDACFVVRDHNGQALAYVYFEDEPGRAISSQVAARRGAADRNERRQIARAVTAGLSRRSEPLI